MTAMHFGLREELGWQRRLQGDIATWTKGFLHENDLAREVSAFAQSASTPTIDAVESWLTSLDGQFALTIMTPQWSLAAVDRIRSIPLLFGSLAGSTYVDPHGPSLLNALGLGVDAVDLDAALSFALTGYTVGNATLYRGIRQLGPGQYLFEAANQARQGEARRYHQFKPWQPRPIAISALHERLTTLHNRLITKLISSANDRTIVIPLSAGLDSRMIASGLVAHGYRNVQCFAYGQPGNHEAKASKIIAERLGLPWTFVPYTMERMRQTFQAADHRSYQESADSLTALYFLSDFPALRYLEQSGWLPSGSILVNGQSGDFITGNHILPPLQRPRLNRTVEERLTLILDCLAKKHFKQWAFLATPRNLERIRSLLTAEIDAIGGLPDSPMADHGVYEWCEFQDRQTKYVVNGQRVYDYLGYDWRLPLWDNDYLDFWQEAPLAAKIDQNLYRTVLSETNWGGVWRDIPVNRKTIRPSWLIPLRWLAKAAHIPFGQSRWHGFETRFLKYWMATICPYAIVPYFRAACDTRGAASGLSWHIESYLDNKGFSLANLSR